MPAFLRIEKGDVGLLFAFACCLLLSPFLIYTDAKKSFRMFIVRV